ncbi:hypothetical protein NN561_003977 [Cricetulus griseus]
MDGQRPLAARRGNCEWVPASSAGGVDARLNPLGGRQCTGEGEVSLASAGREDGEDSGRPGRPTLPFLGAGRPPTGRAQVLFGRQVALGPWPDGYLGDSAGAHHPKRVGLAKELVLIIRTPADPPHIWVQGSDCSQTFSEMVIVPHLGDAKVLVPITLKGTVMGGLSVQTSVLFF